MSQDNDGAARPSEPAARRSSRASQRDPSAFAPATPSRLAHSFAPSTSPDDFATPQSHPRSPRRSAPTSPLLSPTRSPPPQSQSPARPAPPPRSGSSRSATARPQSPPHFPSIDGTVQGGGRQSSLPTLRPPQPQDEPDEHRRLSMAYHTRTSDTAYSFGGRYRGSVQEGPDAVQAVLGETLPDFVFGYGDRASIRSVTSGPELLSEVDPLDVGGGGGGGVGDNGAGGLGGGDGSGSGDDGRDRPRKGLTTTQWLARKHGVTSRRWMYLNYYFPFSNWIRQYRWSWLVGDVVAALTMASFYIPMALSYADNLGHVPPINGLYSFVFNPIIYALLGTCPLMVVGPEAAGSLLVGSVIRSCIEKGLSHDLDEEMHARIAGVVTGMAGAVILIAGLTRLGFLDSVLSRPFLRGFISAIGVVIFIDQLIPEMGLTKLENAAHIDHASPWNKLVFICTNLGSAHRLTTLVSFGCFAITMICREIKKRLQPRLPAIAYVPDRFIIVVLATVLTSAFRWDQHGLDVLGEVKSSTGTPFTFHWPLIPEHMTHIREAMGTSFLIALLGFFESSVAAKSLGDSVANPDEGIVGLQPSANREMVALGFANLVGGCFMAMPAFGGYGRSKVNVATGGRTPMSSIVLSLITLVVVLFLLPFLFYLPKGVLSAMVSVVAWSLIEECPHDIRFFISVRGWSELFLMFAIFAATIFYSLPLGIALGIGLSLLSVIKHATKPRIQILGRVPGEERFENAEAQPQTLEFVEGCLIVKIPEPLTFANTGDLKARLRKLEMYGTTAAHPALPRLRSPEHNRNVIFDVHGVTSLDGSGAQVLREIVEGYAKRDAKVFFCRVPGRDSALFERFRRCGVVELCGGSDHFVRNVDDALRLAKKEADEERFDERYRDDV